MYNVNDTVLYGTNGICKITEISKQDFGGDNAEYYVLRPVHQNRSTIFVPVCNPVLTGKMHSVLSAEEIYSIIDSMPEQDSIWIDNENKRKEVYRSILSQGDRVQLVQVIKTLYLHQLEQQSKGKKLHAVDERMFKDAEKMFYDEIALVLDINPDQVLPFILNQIHIDVI